MKMMILKLMMMMPIMITTMKNPMSVGILLLTQIILSIMFMSMTTKSSWFPMITFLMMIGGLMIMFMYMASMSSNEKFKFNLNLTITTLMILIIPMETLMLENQMNENEEIYMNKKIEMICSMKMYNKKSMSISMLMIMYLLVTMISITKVVKHNEGPLRSKNYE